MRTGPKRPRTSTPTSTALGSHFTVRTPTLSLSRGPDTTGERLLVTDAVQRNSLLRAKPTGALFTRHEEPHIALQRRRLAHPLCRREVPRQGPGIQLATRPGGHILLVHPCLLGGASHPRRHLDPAPGSQDQLIDGQRRQQPIHSRNAPTPLPACARTSTSGNALYAASCAWIRWRGGHPGPPLPRRDPGRPRMVSSAGGSGALQNLPGLCFLVVQWWPCPVLWFGSGSGNAAGQCLRSPHDAPVQGRCPAARGGTVRTVARVPGSGAASGGRRLRLDLGGR